MSDEPFTKIMRRETRKIHNISDALINAKLGLAMSDDQVWADGLLIFYEIFKYLENALDRLKDSPIGQLLDIPGMRRTQEFEKDLEFYLGPNWKKDYAPRHAVVEYLRHLSTLEESNPVLLSAYVYHLYMGLFAGGQILKKKREIVLKLSFGQEKSAQGLAVVNLGPNIYTIKKQMTQNMNLLAEQLSEETKTALIEESKRVFLLNNQMVQTIPGMEKVIFYKILKTATVAAIFASIYYYYFHFRKS